jgi:hypothetical protein
MSLTSVVTPASGAVDRTATLLRALITSQWAEVELSDLRVLCQSHRRIEWVLVIKNGPARAKG